MARQALTSTIIIAKASFWKRTIACIIDNIIIGLPVGVTLRIIGLPGVITDFLVFIAFYAYGILMEHFRQSTWGKDIMQLRVITKAGGRPSLFQSFYRNVGKIISALPLFYGFLRILAPHQRQTIHDEMARCLVIEKLRSDE